jgi:hypothetical protein
MLSFVRKLTRKPFIGKFNNHIRASFHSESRGTQIEDKNESKNRSETAHNFYKIKKAEDLLGKEGGIWSNFRK